uniref:Uncharacterized protein n=1 Tax=Euplotes crassus TaxID=5936 RepID=A0A7S3KS91_EUPCR|mmetsp:Transcript_39065/g.38686  ORF Transcript_39065/g.38686 Transcript_39065/m.38686 type:complete len:273 (+) Transcript_39065:129-947(+)|eukprot:CAMPEP_0197005758 /NCGR_PEP_ID=MMETSP1380-20130617/31124_1 /TAXON_ID=5936 /ORGANISM="Euplotes crassus, Strain CT5" /LENGTH=272 /DNA_ID=CAMNT_0042425017 /DNA_START=476 /DNA_END=1294 /DNA_ORIENTATION=-
MSFRVHKENNLKRTINKRNLKSLLKYRDDSSSYEFFQSKAERSYTKPDHSQTSLNNAQKQLKQIKRKCNSHCPNAKKLISTKKSYSDANTLKQKAWKRSHKQMQVTLNNSKMTIKGNEIDARVPCMMVSNPDNSKSIIPLHPALVLILPLENTSLAETNPKKNLSDNTSNRLSQSSTSFPTIGMFNIEKREFVTKGSSAQPLGEQSEVRMTRGHIQSMNPTASPEQQPQCIKGPSPGTIFEGNSLNDNESSENLVSITKPKDVLKSYCQCFY